LIFRFWLRGEALLMLEMPDMADSFIPEAGYQAPHIFGKDTNTAQTLIYGRPLGL